MVMRAFPFPATPNSAISQSKRGAFICNIPAVTVLMVSVFVSFSIIPKIKTGGEPPAIKIKLLLRLQCIWNC